MTESCSLASSWTGTRNGSFPCKILQERCTAFLVTVCLSKEQEHLQPSTPEQHCCSKSYENQIPRSPKCWIAVLYMSLAVLVWSSLCQQQLPKAQKSYFFLKEKVVKGKNAGGSWLEENHLCSFCS